MNNFIVPQPEDCHFVVQKDARKVICVLKNTKYDAQIYFEEGFRVPIAIAPREKAGKMPNKFVGIATCAPEDNWNEEIGRTLAYNRVIKKYCNSLFRHINTLVDYYDTYLNDFITEVNRFGEKMTKVIDHNDKYVKEQLNT